jgi:hypothetical protein
VVDVPFRLKITCPLELLNPTVTQISSVRFIEGKVSVKLSLPSIIPLKLPSGSPPALLGVPATPLWESNVPPPIKVVFIHWAEIECITKKLDTSNKMLRKENLNRLIMGS